MSKKEPKEHIEGTGEEEEPIKRCRKEEKERPAVPWRPGSRQQPWRTRTMERPRLCLDAAVCSFTSTGPKEMGRGRRKQTLLLLWGQGHKVNLATIVKG